MTEACTGWPQEQNGGTYGNLKGPESFLRRDAPNPEGWIKGKMAWTKVWNCKISVGTTWYSVSSVIGRVQVWEVNMDRSQKA